MFSIHRPWLYRIFWRTIKAHYRTSLIVFTYLPTLLQDWKKKSTYFATLESKARKASVNSRQTLSRNVKPDGDEEKTKSVRVRRQITETTWKRNQQKVSADICEDELREVKLDVTDTKRPWRIMCNCLLASRFRPPIFYKISFGKNKVTVSVQLCHNRQLLLWAYFNWMLFINA
jgi:pyruvate carboxylase